MKFIKDSQQGISTILAFSLLPLSGFATDIYIPSLPTMAKDLHVSNAAIQLSLVVFFISFGVSQLIIGAILDSFGRYRAGLLALAIFTFSSFTVALFPNIYIIYAMRVMQGITMSVVIVGKRAFFMDIYSGEKLKHYTSLFVIIWSTAPILAPFVGGYLQGIFGWQSNFYFLGGIAAVCFVLELLFSGETLRSFHPFKAKAILKVYNRMLLTGDFSLGLATIGCCYGLVVMYGMASPFIIERIFHFPAVTTGYSSLLSGMAIMIGGVIAKSVIKTPIPKKVSIAISMTVLTSGLMILAGTMAANIYVMIGLTICLHTSTAFTVNVIYGYCLTRFSQNAGTAAGLTGGGMYIASSVFSYGLVNFYGIKNLSALGSANMTGALLLIAVFFIFSRFRTKRLMVESVAIETTTDKSLTRA